MAGANKVDTSKMSHAQMMELRAQLDNDIAAKEGEKKSKVFSIVVVAQYTRGIGYSVGLCFSCQLLSLRYSISKTWCLK